MLTTIDIRQLSSPITDLIAIVGGNSTAVTEVRPGVYLIGHFGSSQILPDFEHYPTLEGESHCYGVCDSIENLLAVVPELETSPRPFVVTLTPICRANEPAEDGWRWHKWGPYIGRQQPKHEYLYDDTHIDEVFVYHIYERSLTPAAET